MIYRLATHGLGFTIPARLAHCVGLTFQGGLQ